MFENLVENALKYGAAGKRVDIGFLSATASDGTPDVLTRSATTGRVLRPSTCRG